MSQCRAVVVRREHSGRDDAVTSTYSELNFWKGEPRIDEDEGPPISSGSGGVSTTAQTGAEKQEPEQNIENRMELKIYLLCFVTFALVAIVAGLSIYVSQTRQSLITSERNYRRLWEQHQEMNRTQRQCQQKVHELNSTLESRTSDNSRLDHPQRTCLSNLSELNRTHSDLRHRFNQLEMKNGNITRNIAQVCQYLNRRRDKTLSQDRIAVDCYFISTLETSYDEAKQNCSNSDSNLLEINSKAEESFVKKAVREKRSSYWIGKCLAGNVASNVLYMKKDGKFECSKCKRNSCKNAQHHFICEKSAHLCPDISQKIPDLCQQPVGPTSIK
ncbi:uncharacterized protein LOC132386418 [Hypanus sabinus]|uniref:uncharacterized protein LOC132386418 n=1 Tax=Hypanus sabinus TaxID=79690 RepID=UPI0028C3DEA2|nr:uncharacterized protein LOC132386418 [Hypanus sabinus]